MSALTTCPVVVLTEIKTDPASAQTLIDLANSVTSGRRSAASARALYASPERDALLAVEGYASPGAVFEREGTYRGEEFRRRSASLLGREQRSTVLSIEQLVKHSPGTAPAALLQVRYIEVPPRVLGSYRDWRQSSIFPYVRNASEVASFSAYYTTLGTSPGVYFLSESACEPEQYLAAFTTDAYRKIIADAAGRYIADGFSGLRTSEWHLLSSEEQ